MPQDTDNPLSPEVTFRRAAAGDPEQLHASRLHSVPAIPPPVHSQAEMRQWFVDVVIPEREVWVAIPASRDGLVGLMVIDGDWLDQLYVHPGWQGLGIGRKLVELAKAERPAGLQLWTFQSNWRARRFYQREGFMAVEETDGSGNEEQSPDVRYTWAPLTPRGEGAD